MLFPVRPRLAIVLVVLLLSAAFPAPLLMGFALADGGAPREAVTEDGPRFLDHGRPGDGNQVVRLAVPWTPAPPTTPAANALGYTSVVLAPVPALLPADGVTGFLQGVSRCVSVRTDEVGPSTCTPLTRAASCMALSPTSYCVRTNVPTNGLVTFDLQHGHTALLLTLSVKQQTSEGTLTSAMSLRYENPAWAAGAMSPMESIDFHTTAPILDKLVIRDAPNGGGAAVTHLLTNTDLTHTLYAAGYDVDGLFLGDIAAAAWALSDDDVAELSAATGASVTLDPRAPGAAALSVSVGDVDATVPLRVDVGAPASLLIRDQPNGGGAPVGAMQMRARDAQPLFAAAYDADGNYVEDVAAAWTVPGGCGRVTSQLEAAVFEATRSGVRDCRIAAQMGSLSAMTGLIAVDAGEGLALGIYHADGTPVDALALTTADDVRLLARYADADGNLLVPEEPVEWRVLNGCGTLDVETGPRVTFDPTRVTSAAATPLGACRIIATTLPSVLADALPFAPPLSGGGIGPLAWSGDITVTPGPLALLKVRSAPGGGGVEVGSPVWTTDEPQAFHAAGYDADLNFVANIAGAEWTLTDADVATLNSTSGASVTFEPHKPGTVTVRATFDGLTDATGAITVIPGALGIIVVRDAANNQGIPIDSLPIDSGGSATVHAAGYDAQMNYVGDVEDAAWSVVNACGTITPGPSSSAVFTANAAAREGCQIRAAFGGVVGLSGPVLIDTPPIASLIIRNATLADAFAVPRSAGVPVQLYAAGFGEDDSFYGNQSTAQWSVLSEGSTLCGELSPTTGATVTFTPKKTGIADCRVRAAVGDIVAESSLVDVRPGVTADLVVEGVPGTHVAGSAFPAVTVRVYDAYGNLNTTYAGKVRFELVERVTSGVAVESVPGDHTFNTADAGERVFTTGFEIRRTGERILKVTATNAANQAFAGASESFVLSVEVASLAKYKIDIPTGTSAVAGQGVAAVIKLIAQDAYENTKTDYVGTVVFTSATDPAAELPEPLAFTTGHKGEVVLATGALKFYKAGTGASGMKFRITDGAVSTESAAITVNPAAAARLVVTLPGETYQAATAANTGAPTAQIAGTEFRVQVRAVDEFGNLLTNTGPNTYNGAKSLVFSDAAAGHDGTSPTARQDTTTAVQGTNFGTATTTSFANGIGAYQVKLIRADATSIKVTDNALGISGSSTSVVVGAAAAFQLGIMVDCAPAEKDRACLLASESVTATWRPIVNRAQPYILSAVTLDEFDNLVGTAMASWSAPEVTPSITGFAEEHSWRPTSTAKGTLALSAPNLAPVTLSIEPTTA